MGPPLSHIFCCIHWTVPRYLKLCFCERICSITFFITQFSTNSEFQTFSCCFALMSVICFMTLIKGSTVQFLMDSLLCFFLLFKFYHVIDLKHTHTHAHTHTHTDRREYTASFQLCTEGKSTLSGSPAGPSRLFFLVISLAAAEHLMPTKKKTFLHTQTHPHGDMFHLIIFKRPN